MLMMQDLPDSARDTNCAVQCDRDESYRHNTRGIHTHSGVYEVTGQIANAFLPNRLVSSGEAKSWTKWPVTVPNVGAKFNVSVGGAFVRMSYITSTQFTHPIFVSTLSRATFLVGPTLTIEHNQRCVNALTAAYRVIVLV